MSGQDDEMKPATRLIHAGRDPQAAHGAVNPPIYRATTMLRPSLEAWEEAIRPGHRLVARVRLTDARGNPVCASVHPPAITWSAESG